MLLPLVVILVVVTTVKVSAEDPLKSFKWDRRIMTGAGLFSPFFLFFVRILIVSLVFFKFGIFIITNIFIAFFKFNNLHCSLK